MGIKYVFGRSGKGKSYEVLQQIKRRLDNDGSKKLILIVPEQFTLQAERDLIEKLSLPGIMEIEVLSFTRLAHNILNEAGGLTRIHINEQGKNMVLRKIIDEAEKSLTIYKKAAQQDGFISMFSELLCELKQQDILPADLWMGQEKVESDSILYNKLGDIAHIYNQFNAYLQGRYVDTEDYMNLLIEKIGDAEFLQDAEIWVDGFHSFTPQTYGLLEKLMIVAKDITFTFTMDVHKKPRDGDLFKISELTYEKIRELGQKHNLKGEIIDLEKHDTGINRKSPEIIHMEEFLYSYPYRVFTAETNNIDLFIGMNLYTEIENVASQILSLVRAGYRWNDIAVVTNEMDNYGGLIKRIFDEYDIPYFIDQKRSIMHNPIIECILSSLGVVNGGYRYEDVFRFFKTGFSGLSPDDYEKLENYAIRYGIKGNKWKEPFRWGEEAVLEELNGYRQKFVDPMMKFEKKIKGKRTVAEVIGALYNYLAEIQVQEQLEDWIGALREQGRFEYVNENTQIWNILMEIFDQMVEIIGEQYLSVKETLRVLESGFISMEVGIIPTTIDQVLVGNIQRSKSHDIKALFVVGVNDGILPSGKDEEGILSDEERIKMKDMELPLGFDSEKRAYEEKFMIYSALVKPSEYLWISYAMADQEGKALRPSILIDRLRKLYKNINIKSDVVNDADHQRRLIGTPKSTFKHLVENLRLNVDGKPIEDFWWIVYNWYYGHGEWDQKREAVVDGLFHKNQVDYIEPDYAKKLYNIPIRSSVSRLEQFINCPFAHFVRYGLKPMERQMFKVEAPDIGKIFHDSMEKFTEKLVDKSLDWRQLEKDQCDAVMDEVVDEIVPNHGNGVLLSTHRYKYLVKRLKRISRRAVWTLTEHIKKSGFEPLGYEVAFGIGQIYPAIEIELSDGEKLYLEGRIDRVDLLHGDDESYVKIIDYKSGNKEFSLSDVYYGLQLQLMIYLDAIVNNSEKNNSRMRPAGIFYFKIDDPMIKTDNKVVDVIEKEISRKLKMKGLVLKDAKIVRQMDQGIDGYSEILPVGLKKDDSFYDASSVVLEEEFLILMEHVQNLVKETTHEIIHGNIRIEPTKNGKQKSCDYCEYTTICQFDRLFEDNKYKSLKKLSDGEVFGKINKNQEGIEDGHVDG